MQLEPETFDLKTLAAQTGVAPRTVHFYVQQGLLPPPDGGGRGARYSTVHRDRLRLIRRLQDQHLPLAEIRKNLDRIPDAMLNEVASASPPPKPKSAADYIRSVLGTGPLATSAPLIPSGVHAMRMSPSSAPPSDTIGLASRGVSANTHTPLDRPGTVDRSQWERLVIHPDVEIHLRRPGSRATNRKADKLVDFARSIFKEDA